MDYLVYDHIFFSWWQQHELLISNDYIQYIHSISISCIFIVLVFLHTCNIIINIIHSVWHLIWRSDLNLLTRIRRIILPFWYLTGNSSRLFHKWALNGHGDKWMRKKIYKKWMKFILRGLMNINKHVHVMYDLCDMVNRVDRNKYQIHIPLPPKIDPSVTMMQVEEKPDVTYSDVGGCKEQIEKLREVVETPLLHVSYTGYIWWLHCIHVSYIYWFHDKHVSYITLHCM